MGSGHACCYRRFFACSLVELREGRSARPSAPPDPLRHGADGVLLTHLVDRGIVTRARCL